MKKLSLFVSAFALLSSSAYADPINCGSRPSCDSLGYKDEVADCPSSSEVLKCPFDTAWGKCTRGPSIGDLKYSLQSGDHDGWLLCNGRQFSLDSTAKYYKLFLLIGTSFCHKYTSSTDTSTSNNCQNGMFAIPDYRGFFLQAAVGAVNATATVPTLANGTSGQSFYGTAFTHMGATYNSNLNIPKREELPNLKGRIAHDDTGTNAVDGKLFKYTNRQYGGPSGDGTGGHVDFDASQYNPVYKDYGHVAPASYAANIFIYAGR